MDPVVHFELPYDNRLRMAKFYVFPMSASAWGTHQAGTTAASTSGCFKWVCLNMAITEMNSAQQFVHTDSEVSQYTLSFRWTIKSCISTNTLNQVASATVSIIAPMRKAGSIFLQYFTAIPKEMSRDSMREIDMMHSVCVSASNGAVHSNKMPWRLKLFKTAGTKLFPAFTRS
jgi:hypothetical protein